MHKDSVLTVDIGNSNLVIGWFLEGKLFAKWRVFTNKKATADEYALLFQGLFRQKQNSNPHFAFIASVVPAVTPVLNEALHNLLTEKAYIFEVGKNNLMPILLDQPSELGADRLINSYEAFARKKKACLIVDFGTATTFDVVSGEGKYLGGSIATGLKLSLHALVKNTAKLSMIELKAPPFVIGKNTKDSMQSGLFYGYASLADGLIEKIQTELGESLFVYATGGMAKIMHKLTQKIHETDEDLTIWGMYRIFKNFYSQT